MLGLVKKGGKGGQRRAAGAEPHAAGPGPRQQGSEGEGGLHAGETLVVAPGNVSGSLGAG